MNREMNCQRRLTPEEREYRVKMLKRKRRFRLALVIAAFFLLLAIIISPIVIFAVFRVEKFTVEGAGVYTNEQVIAASEIQSGKSLFFVDLDKAAEKIETTLPYADNVKITKKLPDGIVIRLEETTKAYAVELSNGMYAVTNSSLKVLELSGEVPEKITVISGAVPQNFDVGFVVAFSAQEDDDTEDKTLATLLKITGTLENSQVGDVDYIDISSKSNIYLIYQKRIVMRLGDSSEIEAKLSLGSHAISEENAIDPTQFGVINLTISKQAYFNPADYEDIEELVAYNEKYTQKVQDKENNSENSSKENEE